MMNSELELSMINFPFLSWSYTQYLFFFFWLFYNRSFLRGDLFSAQDVQALKYPLFFLNMYLYLAVISLFSIEKFLPFIENYELSFIPPFAFENINSLISERSQSPSHYWSIVIFALFGVFISKIMSKFYSHYENTQALMQTYTILHVGFCIILALSQNIYLFGTDKMGSDVFFQIGHALRLGLCFALIATSVSVFIGVSVGILSGYARGTKAYLWDYFYNVINAIPSILMLILVLYFVRNTVDSWQNLTAQLYSELSMIALALSLALTQWVPLCRLIRGQVLVLRQSEFIQALELMKVRPWIIYTKHLYPHLKGIVALTIIFDISQYLLAEALLTFIGLGFGGDQMSFGMMINENRYSLLNTPLLWWPLFAVFITLSPFILTLNIIADYFEEKSLKTKGLNDVRC